jgi:hypothetical protein
VARQRAGNEKNRDPARHKDEKYDPGKDVDHANNRSRPATIIARQGADLLELAGLPRLIEERRLRGIPLGLCGF